MYQDSPAIQKFTLSCLSEAHRPTLTSCCSLSAPPEPSHRPRPRASKRDPSQTQRDPSAHGEECRAAFPRLPPGSADIQPLLRAHQLNPMFCSATRQQEEPRCHCGIPFEARVLRGGVDHKDQYQDTTNVHPKCTEVTE